MSVIIIATLFIIVMIVASYVYTGYKRREEYYKSDYSSQTKKNYGEVVIDKGSMGEYDTYRYLDKIEGYKKCLFNTFIPKTNGETTEVDLILLHESGIYVIESKNYSGWIFGDERNNQWTQTLKGSYGTCEKIRFFNPIKQNESHIKWISKYLKIDESELKSIIVFSNRCEFKDITITSDTVMVVKRKLFLHHFYLQRPLHDQVRYSSPQSVG